VALDPAPDGGHLRGIAAQRADEVAAPRQVCGGGESLDEQVLALGHGHRSDAQQAGDAVCAAGQRRAIDARRSDVDPVGTEPVVSDEPPRRPRAGGHHRARGLERPALEGRQLRRSRRGLPHLVAERQVHQDDELQPARLGHDHVRDPAGHQPVDEHDRAVGQ
jgi:hypothetical protein